MEIHAEPARLVKQYLSLIVASVGEYGVLDLACGSGRNGLFLAEHNIPVLFADINSTALQVVAGKLETEKLPGQCWQVDLEAAAAEPLTGKKFDVILVFNYLHRPLIPHLRDCLREGGLLIYETFTVGQAAIGRPRNPDFLLRPGELRGWFEGWEILQAFEGSDAFPPRCYANLVARKCTGQVT